MGRGLDPKGTREDKKVYSLMRGSNVYVFYSGSISSTQVDKHCVGHGSRVAFDDSTLKHVLSQRGT